MISSLIFDMDGVLLDSMPYHADAWVQVSGEWGVQVTHNDIYEIEGSNHVLGLQWLFRRAGKELEPEFYEEILERKIEICSRIADVRPFDGMVECLARLRGRFKLSVVTGSERATVEALLSEFFPNMFDVVVCGDDVENGKPFPDPYLKAVEMLGVTVDECIVIENAPMGVESAKSAGIFCVGVPTYVSPDKLSKADVVLTDHEFLPDYLLKLLNS